MTDTRLPKSSREMTFGTLPFGLKIGIVGVLACMVVIGAARSPQQSSNYGVQHHYDDVVVTTPNDAPSTRSGPSKLSQQTHAHARMVHAREAMIENMGKLINGTISADEAEVRLNRLKAEVADADAEFKAAR